MAKNIGYDRALALAREELAKRDPEKIVQNTGVVWNGTAYEIPWYGKNTLLEDCSIEEQIIGMHYMLAEGPKMPRGRYINYKQVPGAAIYNDNFVKRCISPMVKAFSADLDRFLEKGKLMGGEKSTLGHMSFTLKPLPYIPLTLVLWQGDDEMPSSGNILFDETAIDWLCAEDLVVLAGMPVYKMMKL